MTMNPSTRTLGVWMSTHALMILTLGVWMSTHALMILTFQLGTVVCVSSKKSTHALRILSHW